MLSETISSANESIIYLVNREIHFRNAFPDQKYNANIDAPAAFSAEGPKVEGNMRHITKPNFFTNFLPHLIFSNEIS